MDGAANGQIHLLLQARYGCPYSVNVDIPFEHLVYTERVARVWPLRACPLSGMMLEKRTFARAGLDVRFQPIADIPSKATLSDAFSACSLIGLGLGELATEARASANQ